MAAKRKSSRRRAPPPPPTLVGLLTDRLSPGAALAIKVTAIATALSVLAGVYSYLEGPVPVSSKTLKESIFGVKAEVTNKLGETKIEVLQTSAKNTDEVRTDVKNVKSQVDTIARKQDQARIALLELQQRTLFQQKTQTQSNLNGVETTLLTKPKDAAFLLQRKNELEAIIKYVDGEMATVTEQLRKARQGD